MPKLHHKLHDEPASPADGEKLTVLSFSGFADAANYAHFEGALEEAYRRGSRFVAVDLATLHYINSTGISALIRYFAQLKDRDGFLCLTSVPRQVGLSMHLLGVTSLIPFLKDLPAARALAAEVIAGKRPAALIAEATAGAQEGSADDTPRTARQKAVVRGRRDPGGEARVLLVHPSRSRFSRILRLRFRRLNGGFHLAHDTAEALRLFDEISPDLVVLDHRLDPSGELVSRLKVNKARSLTSVIKIYEKNTDVEARTDFKIWENDYLVDPFEAMQLFSLAEAELLRVPKDRSVFQQQVRFSFRSAPDNVERAHKLSDLIIRQSVRLEEDQTALFAAVKEAIDNAVKHGNSGRTDLAIDVNFLVDNRKVTVLVEDMGKGFDFEYYLSRIDTREAFEKARNRIVTGGQRGGLGILLMHKCCDRLEYSGGGNVVRLEKNIER